ncbi:MAG TPA: hypothetical protein VNJ03_04875 [Vicinamibacterales bacterium]|nr:hypothetical protein [Vicinamibacterales bacterium]
MTKRAVIACAMLTAGLVAGACGKPVDLKQSLQVTDVTSGWFDAGIVEGKNKLVPTVTFTLRKAEGVANSAVALNLVFKTSDTGDESNDEFVQRVEFNGNETAPIVVRSKSGYTADPPQSRADMLKHSQFRDMDVEIFAKQTSQWVSLHKTRIERQLLTR